MDENYVQQLYTQLYDLARTIPITSPERHLFDLLIGELRNLRHQLANEKQVDHSALGLIEQLIKDVNEVRETLYGAAGQNGMRLDVDRLKQNEKRQGETKLTRYQAAGLWGMLILGVLGLVVSSVSAAIAYAALTRVP